MQIWNVGEHAEMSGTNNENVDSLYPYVFPGTGWMKIFLRYHESSMRTMLPQVYKIPITCTQTLDRILDVIQSSFRLFNYWTNDDSDAESPALTYVSQPMGPSELVCLCTIYGTIPGGHKLAIIVTMISYLYWRYILGSRQPLSLWSKRLQHSPTILPCHQIKDYMPIREWKLPVMKPANNVRHLRH